MSELKNEIITRLFKEGHISFEEVLLLGEKEVEHHHTTVPVPVYPFISPQYPYSPGYPYPNPYYITSTSDHISEDKLK